VGAGGDFLRDKAAAARDDNSPLTRTEIKNGWCCTSIVPYVRTAGTETTFCFNFEWLVIYLCIQSWRLESM